MGQNVVPYAYGPVTKNLVRGKKRSGRTIFSRQNLVRGTKFGYQNRSGPTKNGPV